MRPTALLPHAFSLKELASLRDSLRAASQAVSFGDEPQLAARVASLGLQREILTKSNELAPYVFDRQSGRAARWEDMRAELVSYQGEIGVHAWVEGFDELELRLRGLSLYVHPTLSRDEDGALRRLVFFPASIQRIAAREGAELVIVPEWALNTIFGGFRAESPITRPTFGN